MYMYMYMHVHSMYACMLLLCVLRMQLFSHMPDVSLECSSNVLQIHTCVDSCIALRDLLVYLASDGDLHPRPSEPRDHSRRSPAMVKQLMTLGPVSIISPLYFRVPTLPISHL